MSSQQPTPDYDAEIAKTAAELTHLPVEMVAMIFATHEPAELNALMDRAFGASYDDTIMQTLVTLANSFAHALERHRRRRGLHPLKLRCTDPSCHKKAR